MLTGYDNDADWSGTYGSNLTRVVNMSSNAECDIIPQYPVADVQGAAGHISLCSLCFLSFQKFQNTKKIELKPAKKDTPSTTQLLLKWGYVEQKYCDFLD